jgi:hypothetical protein
MTPDLTRQFLPGYFQPRLTALSRQVSETSLRPVLLRPLEFSSLCALGNPVML